MRNHALSWAYFSKSSRLYSSRTALREMRPLRSLAIFRRSGSVGARVTLLLNLASRLAGSGVLPNRRSNHPIVFLPWLRQFGRDCITTSVKRYAYPAGPGHGSPMTARVKCESSTRTTPVRCASISRPCGGVPLVRRRTRTESGCHQSKSSPSRSPGVADSDPYRFGGAAFAVHAPSVDHQNRLACRRFRRWKLHRQQVKRWRKRDRRCASNERPTIDHHAVPPSRLFNRCLCGADNEKIRNPGLIA